MEGGKHNRKRESPAESNAVEKCAKFDAIGNGGKENRPPSISFPQQKLLTRDVSETRAPGLPRYENKPFKVL